MKKQDRNSRRAPGQNEKPPLRDVMALLPHPKQRGEWAELQFMSEAALQGLTVARPWGDSARYDFIVEWHGHCRRVQVKSTGSRRRSGAYVCEWRSRGAKERYSERNIDFVVVYVIPEESWYVIPVKVAMEYEAGLRLGGWRSPLARRMEAFRGRWELLKSARNRAS